MSDYRSNLTAPDLRPNFKHLHWRPMGHSFGHDVASDFSDLPDPHPLALYKSCGLWTMDEAAILYNVAKRMGGQWIDIGAHTGWTTKYVWIATKEYAYPVDPMLAVPEFVERFCENMWCEPAGFLGAAITSNAYFKQKRKAGAFAHGVVIDGDHSEGKPLEDAMNARAHLHPDGVIIFHDFVGQPVREAVVWLMDHGFQCRIYNTPHMIACTWRGEFTPPDHAADLMIDWEEIRRRCYPFPFERTV